MLLEKSFLLQPLPSVGGLQPPTALEPATAAVAVPPTTVKQSHHQPSSRNEDESIENDRYIIHKSKNPLYYESALVEWLRNNTTIPVPIPYKQGYDDKSRRFYEIFEKPQGVSLCDCWDDLSPTQQETVISDLRGYMQQLRSITTAHIPNVAARDGFLDPRDGVMRGPYHSTEEFVDAIATRIDRIGSLYDAGPTKKVIRFLKALRGLSTDHEMVFTHGNICPENILVNADGRVVAILDWSEAGYAPAFWEYVKSYLNDDDSDFFLDEAPDRIMEPWPIHLAVMMHAHGIIW
jgi:aminoglycoside phosphotransferase